MRGGADVQLPNDGDFVVHCAQVVYREMLLQICTDYPGLPDPRALELHEILFFYNGLRPGLRKHTAPKR